MLEAAPLSEGESGGEDEVEETLQQMFPSQWTEEEFQRMRLGAQLVIWQNVMNPLTVQGQVLCPICDIGLADGHGRPWQGYTQAEYAVFDIDGSEDDHLVFLSKYKNEISEILRASKWS